MIVRAGARIGVMIGHPIGQVKSPELFNRYFAERGEDAVLVPVDLLPEAVSPFLTALRGWPNAAGCIVTVPHKRTVVERLDQLTDRARRLQAVNVVRREPDGCLTGDMVDGLGFTAAAAAHGFAPAGRRALVVGAGGVGSAIADALCEGGVAELALTDLKADRAAWLRDALSRTFAAVRVSMLDGASLEGFDLVANATPVGMDGTNTLPLAAGLIDTLQADVLVADVTTRPVMTPLLQAAAVRGCRVQTGPEMAAAQMEILGRFMGLMA